MTRTQQTLLIIAVIVAVLVLLATFFLRLNPAFAANQDAYLSHMNAEVQANRGSLGGQVLGIFNPSTALNTLLCQERSYLCRSYPVLTAPQGTTTIPIVTVPKVATRIQDGMSANDWLLPDVCLDASGNVLAKSPLDPSCVSIRNVQYGEKLPYSKHDFATTVNNNPASDPGYQANDAYPTSSGYIAHTFDYGPLSGGTFGKFDASLDGFDVYKVSGTYASIVSTDDSTGVQYFQSPSCVNGTTSGLSNSWISFPSNVTTSMVGSIVAKLAITTSPTQCPSGFSQSYTNWQYVSSFTYTSGISLPTVISSHYDHSTPAASQAMERFYYTRELGNARWESWQRSFNANGMNAAQWAQAIVSQGRCTTGPSTMSDAGGTWYRVDCRDWTNIVPIANQINWFDPSTWPLPSVFGN